MWLVINETEILLLKILLSLVRPKPARSSLTRPAVGSLCIIPGGGGRTGSWRQHKPGQRGLHS